MSEKEDFIGTTVICAAPDGEGGFTTITLSTLFGKRYIIEAFIDGRSMTVDEVE